MYLTASPTPLSQTPTPFTSADIPVLVGKLHDYSLTKGELIMILNMRPSTLAQLWACIGEFEERFTETQQQDILNVIGEVLGSFPPSEAAADMADTDPIESVEDTAS